MGPQAWPCYVLGSREGQGQEEPGDSHSPCSAKLGSVEPFPSRSLARPGAAGYLHLPQPHWPEPETKQGAQCGQGPGALLAQDAWPSGSAGAREGPDGHGFICMTFLLPQSSAVKRPDPLCPGTQGARHPALLWDTPAPSCPQRPPALDTSSHHCYRAHQSRSPCMTCLGSQSSGGLRRRAAK